MGDYRRQDVIWFPDFHIKEPEPPAVVVSEVIEPEPISPSATREMERMETLFEQMLALFTALSKREQLQEVSKVPALYLGRKVEPSE